MTTMPALRDIQNDTPANAVDVDFNFGLLEAHVGSELINRDGSVPMLQPLVLGGPAPSQPNHAVTKSYVDQTSIPVGTIWMYAGGSVPTGWVICDGTPKSTTDPAFVALFAAIGYAYGGAGGTFNLPNLQGRFPVGRNPGDATFDTLNDQGGSKDQTVVLAHQHTVPTMSQSFANHQHYAAHRHPMTHSHPIPVRKGYDIPGAFATGNTNAVYTSGPSNGAALTFPNLRATTIWTGEPEGGTKLNSDNSPASTDWDDMGSNSHVTDPSGGITVTLGNVATTGGPAGSGAGANLPPFITINFMIRIGI